MDKPTLEKLLKIPDFEEIRRTEGMEAYWKAMAQAIKDLEEVVRCLLPKTNEGFLNKRICPACAGKGKQDFNGYTGREVECEKCGGKGILLIYADENNG